MTLVRDVGVLMKMGLLSKAKLGYYANNNVVTAFSPSVIVPKETDTPEEEKPVQRKLAI